MYNHTSDTNTDPRHLLRLKMEKIDGSSFMTDGPPAGYDLPTEYIEKMKVISEKYKPIQWLPLDIPKIDIGDPKEFLEIYDSQRYPVVRIKPDVAEPWSKEDHPFKQDSSWNKAAFNGLHLYQNPMIDLKLSTFYGKVYLGDIPVFKRIVEQVHDYIPHHPFISIFIWESLSTIIPHRDAASYWKCPTDFRSMLYDENDKPTLYVAEDGSDEPIYIDLPEDTNTFCWSNGKMVHGSDYHGKRKLLLIMTGIQHTRKSVELFDRSIAKYKDKLNYKLEM